MNYSNIPAELTELPQWVCVKNDSKVPMQAKSKKPASSTDSNTWCDFETAVLAVADNKYDHIGFVFANNRIVGIDIDDVCYDDDGFFSTVTIDIVQHTQSYLEKSRSGRGVHIFIKGDLPFKGKNNGNGVEIYKSSRYFIVTGEKLIYDTIIQNQTAIDYIVDKYFQDISKESENPSNSQRIYSPVFTKPENGKIALRPTYPTIKSGMRNLSLTSLAGQMHNRGYSKKEIYQELLYANKAACIPPLPAQELQTIVNSVTRYRRG